MQRLAVERKNEQQSNQSLLRLISSMKQNGKNVVEISNEKRIFGEETMQPLGATLARFAKRSITITASVVRSALSGGSRSRTKAECCGQCVFYKKSICMMMQVPKMAEDWCPSYKETLIQLAGD